MNLKEYIINDFLNDPEKNYPIYQANRAILGEMYDRYVEFMTRIPNFKLFLENVSAVSETGAVRYDRVVDFYDKESKKEVKGHKVVFKYPVYNYIHWRYTKEQSKVL